jgi:hypothetical protein
MANATLDPPARSTIGRSRQAERPLDRTRTASMPKRQAEELLDWLEAHGWSGWLYCGEQGFWVEIETRRRVD